MRRIDSNKFKKVQSAITLADKGLVKHAAMLCSAIGVPIDVAYRVILKPSQRRTNNDNVK